MSEIEKMYENANIEKEVIKGCYDYYSKLGIDIWKENDCRGKNCDTCKKDKSIKRYPQFTAEKQLELIKWFIHSEHFSTIRFNVQWVVDDIASYINFLWQVLTPEEKQQVKGILE